MTGHDGASSSNAQRKPLQVLMTSKSMSVRDSKEVIYTSYKFTHTIPGTYILVMSAGDESIFTIRPKVKGYAVVNIFILLNFDHPIIVTRICVIVLCNFQIYGLGITAYEGHRGLEDSVVASSKHASFVVYHFKSNHLETHPISCKAIYDDKYYTLTPCIIDKSTDAKEEFKIMNAKGETIAEVFDRICVFDLHIDPQPVSLT